MTVFAVVAWLSLNGCSLPGAAGIVANLQPESGLDPGAIGRSGLGLPQWSGPRRTRMLAALGARWRDGYAQLGYLMAEAKEIGVWGPVCAATDAGAAGSIFMLGFERTRSHNTRHRAELARTIAAAMRVR